MFRYSWDSEKNEWLKVVRGISFEEVVAAVASGGLRRTIEHPNPGRYANQRIFVVLMNGYIYYVPFVQTGDAVFLKTIIPNRKATKSYLKGDL